MNKTMEKSTENAIFLDGRDYTAADLYRLIGLLVGTGVYTDELAPTATNENMSVTHGTGHAWIRGIAYWNTIPFTLDIATADGSLNRYDSLMLRLDLSINEVYAVIIQGAYASNPTPPACVRNAETFDLKLCDIYIPAGCTKITQSNITDTRLDSSVCGIPVFPVEHLNTSSFYRQINTDLTNFQQKNEADFTAWVEGQKSSNLATLAALVEIVRNTSDDSKTEILDLLAQLNDLVDDDTAGKLINQINEKLPLSGGTMTGPISIPDPGGSKHAANKSYVDSKHTHATTTLPASGWSSAAPYTLSVLVSGVEATDSPHISPVYDSALNTALAQQEAWAMVSKAVAGSGSITFTCFEDKPSVDIPVQVEVNR